MNKYFHKHMITINDNHIIFIINIIIRVNIFNNIT